MDGSNRAIAFALQVLSVVLIGSASPVAAQDDEGANPVEQRVYKSDVLKKEFLGAILVNLAIDTQGSRPDGVYLELRTKNTKKTPRYKSKFVSISLKRSPSSSQSGSADDSAKIEGTYTVTGLPADLEKSDETLKLRLADDSAQLMVVDSDGKTCNEIKLARLALPKKSESTELNPRNARD